MQCEVLALAFLYSVYVLEEKHFYKHFDMYLNFHLRVIYKILPYLLIFQFSLDCHAISHPLFVVF